MESLKKHIANAQIFGQEVASEILEYSYSRERVDAPYLARKEAELQVPGKHVGTTLTDESVVIAFENFELTVSSPFPDCFKICWGHWNSDTLLPHLGGPISNWAQNVAIEEGSATIKSGNSSIVIDKTGEISLYREGIFLRKDEPPALSANRVVHTTKIRDGTSIFGFGEKALGLDMRGSNLELWNHDHEGTYGPDDDPLYLAIPVYMELENGSGTLAFYNNPAKGKADVCASREDEIKLEFEGGDLGYLLGTGSIRELTEMLARISGLPMLPPKWSLGFHQSRYSYMSQSEIMGVAEGFRKHDLPISAIHMDIDYMDGYRIFTLNKENFPDLPGLSTELDSRGIKLVAIVDPGVKCDETYSVYREGLEQGYFAKLNDGSIVAAPVWPGTTSFPDFTREDVRKWWASKYSFFTDNGVAGFWHDMNEPVAFTIWGDNTLPMSTEFSIGKHALVHNLYALYMAKGVHDRFFDNENSDRPFMLSRSGWAGIQRYAFVWTGDSASTWAEMQSTVSTIINLGLSGIPFCGADVGGFSGSPSKALFTRWFQMGAFLPFFRVHSAKNTAMREPWRFGEETLNVLRKFLKLRYRLLPYYLTLSWEANQTGHPIIRPAFWTDPNYDHADDSVFLVGNDMLVAPVVTMNARSMPLVLPRGRWFSLWDDSEYEGVVDVPVGPETIPVFIRSGSLIPTLEDGEIVINIYIGSEGKGSMHMYDDKVKPGSYSYEFDLRDRDGRWALSYKSQSNGLEVPERIGFRLHGTKTSAEGGTNRQIDPEKQFIYCSEANGEIFLT